MLGFKLLQVQQCRKLVQVRGAEPTSRSDDQAVGSPVQSILSFLTDTKMHLLSG